MPACSCFSPQNKGFGLEEWFLTLTSFRIARGGIKIHWCLGPSQAGWIRISGSRVLTPAFFYKLPKRFWCAVKVWTPKLDDYLQSFPVLWFCDPGTYQAAGCGPLGRSTDELSESHHNTLSIILYLGRHWGSLPHPISTKLPTRASHLSQKAGL